MNFPDVRYVINWGPARSLLDHHQEAGRAGGDGKQADVVVIYHGNQLTHHEDNVKDFVRSNGCLRVASYRPLDKSIKPMLPAHDWCSNCKKTCTCSGNKCKLERLPFEQESIKAGTSAPTSRTRLITEEDKDDLSAALEELQLMETSGNSLFDETSSHGFSAELISDIVENSHSRFTLEDITDAFPVFSLRHAFKILEVFHEVFGDIPKCARNC